MASRMAAQSSQLYGTNLRHMLDDLTPEKDGVPNVNMEDRCARGRRTAQSGYTHHDDVVGWRCFAIVVGDGGSSQLYAALHRICVGLFRRVLCDLECCTLVAHSSHGADQRDFVDHYRRRAVAGWVEQYRGDCSRSALDPDGVSQYFWRFPVACPTRRRRNGRSGTALSA